MHDIDNNHQIEVMKISVLDALRVLQDAWCQVTSTTIQNCFHHCRFSDDTTSSDMETIDEENENAEVFSIFADLQDRSCIPEEMDPEEYLLMDEKVPTSAMSTDDEIIRAVLSSKRENEDKVGEDDDCCSAPQQSISKEQVIRVKKTREAATPRTRITCELFGKPKNAVCT